MHDLIEKLKEYGVGRRKLDDALFESEKPVVLGVYDIDDEDLCHTVIKTSCTIPGCKFTTDSLLDFENHYNSSHRYSCCECKKILPSPHLLDLHVQETHDSYFAVCAARKPSYCCYIEECKEKFLNPEERLEHCVKIHKIPKDFRFEQKPKKQKKQSKISMDVDPPAKTKKFSFQNSKQRSFGYSGRKFTRDDKSNASVNMDTVMADLKDSLPE